MQAGGPEGTLGNPVGWPMTSTYDEPSFSNNMTRAGFGIWAANLLSVFMFTGSEGLFF